MKNVQIVASSPGKVILHGEHSVVYGRTALAAVVDLRTWTSLTIYHKKNRNLGRNSELSSPRTPPCPQVRLTLHDLGISYSWKFSDILQLQTNVCGGIPNSTIRIPQTLDLNTLNLIQAFVIKKIDAVQSTSDGTAVIFLFLILHMVDIKQAMAKADHLDFEVWSQIPIGAGLGSSAALAVSIVAVLLAWRDRNSFKKAKRNQKKYKSKFLNCMDNASTISSWSLLAEKIAHGNPSGIDNGVITHGGFLTFVDGESKSFLEMPASLHLLLVNTQVSRNTKDMIEYVASRYCEKPQYMEKLFDQIESVCKKSVAILKQMTALKKLDHFAQLEMFFDTNQDILRKLGVSHTSIEKIISTCLKYGLHGKLTGAGGGGFVIALISPSIRPSKLIKLRSMLFTNGFPSIIAPIGGCGVTVQTRRMKN